MNPCEVPIGSGQTVQLRLLAHPENAEGHERHKPRDKVWCQMCKSVPEIVLIVNGFHCGRVDIQYEQRHGHRKNSIADRGNPVNTRTGKGVIPAIFSLQLRCFRASHDNPHLCKKPAKSLSKSAVRVAEHLPSESR